VNRGSLAFTPVRWALLIGSRPGAPPLRRRIGSRGPLPQGSARRPDPAVGLLSWGSSWPLRRRDCLCVHSRLDRRPDFGPGLPRPELVPFLPFLPAPTVSSAEARPESRTLDSVRVCCTPQPALGFALFPAPFHLAVVATRRSFGAFPSSEDPSKLFPLRQPDQLVTAPPPRGFGCVHRVAFPLAVGCRRIRVATDPPAPRPQGFVPPKSPLRSRSVATSRPLDAPMGFWVEHVPMPAAREALDGQAPSFPLRLQLRSGVPHLPRGMGKAKSRLRLAPSWPMLGPTRRSVVRRSGPLATRRQLRFRSA